MESKTALQIFCENLEHNMSIETFSFYTSLKRDCLEIEKQQIIEARSTAIVLYSNDKEDYLHEAEKYYNQTYELIKANKKGQIISVKN